MPTIHNVIIHNVEKKQHSTEVLITKRSTEIKMNKHKNDFFTHLLNTYYNKSNPSYGIFNANLNSFPYQILLKEFLDNKRTFHNFSVAALNHFSAILKNETNASGGFFLATYFTVNKQDFLAIILLNNTTNFDIDEESLDIVEKLSLDIEKIDVACIVNVSRWNKKENTYLSFTKGRKKISDYFLHFIGCTQLTDSKHYSQHLKAAFNDYLESKEYNDEDKSNIKMKAYSYIAETVKKKEEFKISSFANVMFPDNPSELTEHLSKEEYGINANFRCDISTFKDYHFIHFSSKDLNFKFNRRLLDNSTIVFNKQKRTLTINNLDDSVINQIETI